MLFKIGFQLFQRILIVVLLFKDLQLPLDDHEDISE